LVAKHLAAIADWKSTFDDAAAWERVMKAERTVAKHCKEHGCDPNTGHGASQHRVVDSSEGHHSS